MALAENASNGFGHHRAVLNMLHLNLSFSNLWHYVRMW
jgi:hypothetical protein